MTYIVNKTACCVAAADLLHLSHRSVAMVTRCAHLLGEIADAVIAAAATAAAIWCRFD